MNHAIQDTAQAKERRKVRNRGTGRKKTSIACQYCWKSKTRCGTERPCKRCIRLGHMDCHDRPAKSRKRQHIQKNSSNKSNNLNDKSRKTNQYKTIKRKRKLSNEKEFNDNTSCESNSTSTSTSTNSNSTTLPEIKKRRINPIPKYDGRENIQNVNDNTTVKHFNRYLQPPMPSYNFNSMLTPIIPIQYPTTVCYNYRYPQNQMQQQQQQFIMNNGYCNNNINSVPLSVMYDPSNITAPPPLPLISQLSSNLLLSTQNINYNMPLLKKLPNVKAIIQTTTRVTDSKKDCSE